MMPSDLNRHRFADILCLSVIVLGLALNGAAQTPKPLLDPVEDHSPVTNLLQLTHIMNSESEAYRDVWFARPAAKRMAC
jgi:hypothetical protein